MKDKQQILVLFVILIAQIVFGEPRIFAPGIISSGDQDSHPAFSPDGSTLVFLKMDPDFSKWTLFQSNLKNGKWSEPSIAEFSGQYWDADPSFSKDGNTLYFISNRPIKEGDPQQSSFDIWRIAKTGNGWSKPVRLPAQINSEKSEYYPTTADDGTLYFGSRRDGGKGGADIYRSRVVKGEYQTPENLGDAVNTSGNEFEPFIAPDQSYLIFMASAGEDLQGTDLYISYNENGKWSNRIKLPEPFNSGAMEFSPKISADGKYFFFSSSRNLSDGKFQKPESTTEMLHRIHEAGNGLLDIYQVEFSELENALKKTAQ